ncbi:hypothetical protein P175DRAFT_0457199 [Aspergillus ochraceoroseus IBT 24754]|uniref:Uncharacterized protein n=2 Tax=Aspergillus ochraceoroseus TaxID=138278 RepID=A0A2T5M0A1_9EURO|nr:uncharacterized protein P175DRAFT_0457199 [Aspergillus ochraceoroseus IBT 24754]KKK12488.1 hypothetical protein AOCH_006591 [Aspergillus ochraceoroseus]PTU21960.1 hypothetical protein P175DRAFT_0457199 [Aspergillus ochraceoroseus IBT 24754]
MEAFDKIPYEVLFRINAYAADWVALESLFHVSSRVGELFAGEPNSEADPEAIRLVESILAENPVMRHELHRHFRMSMRLRQPSLADTSFAEFMARDYSVSSLTSSPPSLITRAMLQEMVIIATNIQRLACACLTTFLTRLRKVQPRLREYTHGPPFSGAVGTAPYKPHDSGPPSWIEEYRVYRALWHLQLYSDLLVVGDRLNWPQSDFEYLRTSHVEWNELQPIAGEEELKCISECLGSLYCVDVVPTTQSPVESDSSDMHLITQVPNASQLQCKFSVWAPPSPPEIPHNDDDYGSPKDIWGQGLERSKHNRTATYFRMCRFHNMKYRTKFQVCSIQDWRPWRGLGMPMWDLCRLYWLGLWPLAHSRGLKWRASPTDDGIDISQAHCLWDGVEEVQYRMSVFMGARMEMERQEKVERIVEDGHGLDKQ